LIHVPCSFLPRRFHGLSRQEATKEDKQAQASEDAEEDALAAAAQVVATSQYDYCEEAQS
jgi:hypothetical protein